ncbi:MAG: metallophosphoesterase family protein [Actinomycetota bacterium]
MTVKIVSDLHSRVEALRNEIAPNDTLLLLGDLINIVDYTAMEGILVDVFGVRTVQEVVALRAERRFDEARAVIARRREGRGSKVRDHFVALTRKAYREVRDALPHRTCVIFGNADSPSMAEELAGPGVEFVDGKVVELQGLRVGFVGGGLPTALGVAGEISEAEFDAKLDGVGEVDVICTHMPPDLPELTYDTLAARHERGSPRLLEYIREVRPRRAYFGHIHQPLVSSTHVGPTHVVNAGYFRRTARAVPLDF